MRAHRGVEISLNALVEQLDDHLAEQATRAYRFAAGLSKDAAPLPELPELSRPDVFQHLTELVSSPRTDDAKRARLVLLRRHAARAFVEARAADATARIDAFLRSKTFFAGAKTWSLLEALLGVPRVVARDAREAVERELSHHLLDAESLWARRADLELHAASELKLSPPALAELVQGRPLAPRLERAAALLRETADAYGDLLTFALKRLDAQLHPRSARAHDAERAMLAPWLFESFRREDLQHAVTRCLGDLGLNPSAEGRITIDTEPREGRVPGAHLFELRVPDQVRLLLTPDLGFDAYAGWLRAWGTAMHRAHVSRTAAFVERRLGDRAVVDAIGCLFESLLLDEGWLKRYLRLTASQAREAARVFAFRQLGELRRTAAIALVHRELLERGPSRPLQEEYVTRLSQALGVEAPRGRYLHDVGTLSGALVSLDAWALEGALHAQLRERFNEDFWRNPATGRWLVGYAAAGQRDDATAMANAPGGEAPDLLFAARRRVAVMGA